MQIDKLLIHTCCADCLINTLNSFKDDNQIDEKTYIEIFFYNPNIHPRSEYYERLNAVKKILTDSKHNTKLIVPDYKPQEYFQAIQDKGRRCIGCWSLRLEKLIAYAKDNGFKYISSTLLTSSYQDTKTILEIFRNIAKDNFTILIPNRCSDCIIHKGFYKQNFCGCCFSLVERMQEKQLEDKVL